MMKWLLLSNCRWTDIRFLMNNFIKDLISSKIDHMEQGVHRTVQSSIKGKDKRSYKGKYRAELKRSSHITNKQ